MSSQDLIEQLRDRHRGLEAALVQEINRPLPNTETVADLKRQKLRIKDQIMQLEHSCH